MAEWAKRVPGWLRGLAGFAVVFLVLMGAGIVLTPDPVRTASRPDQFDAHAARERLVRILGDETPHPVDSVELDAVREALVREIGRLGIIPEVSDTFACRPQPRGPLIDCGRVQNILFSLGPDDGPAVLQVAHYDSVPAGPGASDDGLGVSVLLETARVLQGEQLDRRVIFLFTDGEEQALLGAYAFTRDPIMQKVEALVNVEARGSRGPAMFFESNLPNADAVRAYAEAPRPLANSIMADVYRLLPNSTDVTAMLRPGLDVVNIALLDGVEDYHRPHDTLASQDLRSVQHAGDMALAVTRRFAQAGADSDAATPMVYTDIASRFFVYSPAWAMQAALVFSVLVAGAAWWRTGRERRWLSLAAPLIALAIAGGLAVAATFALGALRPGEAYAYAYPEATRAWCILFALLGTAIAALLAASAPRQAGAAGLLWFALLGFGGSFVAPGVSILFALPALAYAVVWLISLRWRRAETFGAWAAAIVTLLIWAPMFYLVELALGFDLPVVLSIAAVVIVWACWGVLVHMQGPNGARASVFALSVAALLALVTTAFVPAATQARPQPLNFSYFLNTVTNEARVTAGAATRALPRQFADEFYGELLLPGDLIPTWTREAPVEAVAVPQLEGISVIEANGERLLRGRLVMNGVYRAIIRIPAAAAPLRARLNGVEASFADTGGERGEFMSLACQGRACDGAEIEIALTGNAVAAPWFIIGQSPGASSAAAAPFRTRRPDTATPIQNGDSVITLSAAAF